MRSSPENPDELDLDLPALDGADDGTEADLVPESLDSVLEDEGDALDDSTGEDAPMEGLAGDEMEGGWLVDAESDSALDVGTFDLVVSSEESLRGGSHEDDEADAHGVLEDLVSADESLVADGGEEGPLDDDEELRDEDLPALDADDDGEGSDLDLYDRAGTPVDEDDLRWDDRAWARVAELGASTEEGDDSGVLAVPGDDPSQSARDATWRRLDESGRVMAAALVPGGSVVLALSVADHARALLVRVQPGGAAHIIAEVDPHAVGALGRGGEDDGEACAVTFLRWDAARGCLFVGGNFGVEVYRPGL